MTEWEKLNDVWELLGKSYVNFTKKYKKVLYNKYGIENAKTYAEYVFKVGDIEY